jgi:plasmid stabilization system protein ParE
VTSQLVVSPEAARDIADAVAWLRERSPGLPNRFGAEIEDVYASIIEHPEMYPLVYRRLHRAIMRRFPYSVFYVVDAGAIVVIGVIHQARDESAWKRRA